MIVKAPGRALRALVVVAALTVAQPALASAQPAGAPPSAEVVASPTAATAEPAGYVPLSPARLLDTRSTGATVDGVGKGGGSVKGGSPRSVQVTGRGGVPSSGVSAVVLNVTAVKPTVSTYITAYPDGEARPNTSNLNVVKGSVTPNLVVTKPGSTGKVAFFVAEGASDVLADVAGYFPTGGSFVPLSPGRLLDTRATGSTIDGQGKGGGALGSAGTRTVQVTGRHGIPTTGVDSVVLNVTGVKPTKGTYVTAWPAGATRPTTSNLNLLAGEVRPNLVVVKVGSGGAVSLFNNAGSVDVLADVAGWIPTGTTFRSVTPARLLDTRTTGATVDGQGKGSGAVGAAKTVDVQVTGRYGIPATGVRSVVLNVTGVTPTSTTYVTGYPAGETRPNASNLNLVTGEVRPNLVIAKVGAGGKVRLFNNAGSTHLLADVAGYVVDGSTGTPAIAGTVRQSGTSSPLAGVDVYVDDPVTGEGYTATTDASGHWSVATVAAGGYTVCFAPEGATGGSTDATGYVESCHGQNAPGDEPTVVPVTAAGGVVVDKTLTSGAAVAGKVVQETTNAKLRGVSVSVRPVQSEDQRFLNAVTVTTAADGTYRATGIAAGTYEVCFDATDALGGTSDATGYVNECYDGITEFYDGVETFLTLAPGGQRTGIDATLARGAALQGTVREDGTSKPLGGVFVNIEFSFPGDNPPWFREMVTYAETDATGHWVIKGLRAGGYSVCYEGADSSGGSATAKGHVSECHLNKSRYAPDPTLVQTTIGSALTVDAGLAIGAGITGKVVQAGGSGAPLEGVFVDAWSPSGDSEGFATTGPDGTYAIRGLAAATDVEVCFSASGASGGTSTVGYVDECFDDKQDGQVPTPVRVTAGANTTVNGALAAAGGVQGRITDATGGAPLANAEVVVHQGDRQWSDWTDDTGAYSLIGIPAGSGYVVCVSGFGATGPSPSGYVGECYDNQPFSDFEPTGTPVSVVAGQYATVDLALTRGAVVAGRVLDDSTNAPIEGVYVSAFSATLGESSQVFTEPDGTYRMDGMSARTDWVVCFDGFGLTTPSPTGYEGECHLNQPYDPTGAGVTKVSTTAGQTTTVDARLARSP
ncbi:carboxypeptidase-like regulatory domain-containing protein [Phycicoccus sonneratiae]|uniref:Carboxypeptidase regulatory-like domain-containing protein n=1 Tax=Phycicoccus sonneratiae TaxID=2807628 RepID=A0ABS2CML0_9MICO|nr:carboxypeptidase-like regulatory domain-containing protein [Phycicoccus sonneraticus]MBM6401122.1 carboxypeptidase regulatory-like domain-containing protein [Phycicoccus sonneraticus]